MTTAGAVVILGAPLLRRYDGGVRPMYLPVAEYDPLYGGVVGLAEAAMSTGVAVTVESWLEMVHGWQGLATAGVPEALAAFARTRAVLDSWGL